MHAHKSLSKILSLAIKTPFLPAGRQALENNARFIYKNSGATQVTFCNGSGVIGIKEVKVEKEKLLSSKIVGWIEIIISIILLVYSVVLTILRLLAKRGSSDYLLFGLGGFVLIFSIFMLITGIFTLKLNPKGRILNFMLAGILILHGLPAINIIFMPNVRIEQSAKYFPTMILGILFVIIGLLLIFFFTRHKVKEQFK
jgi:hypothetical protein